MNKIYGLFVAVFTIITLIACGAYASGTTAGQQSVTPLSSGGSKPSLPLTITEEDALRRQIAQCWNAPPRGPVLQVKIVIDVNPDRTISSTKIIDDAQHADDPYYKSMAKSAMLALQNPKCSPLELPADKYDQWKRIEFTFDPRDML